MSNKIISDSKKSYNVTPWNNNKVNKGLNKKQSHNEASLCKQKKIPLSTSRRFEATSVGTHKILCRLLRLVLL